MSKRDPLACARESYRDVLLKFETDTNGLAWERCPNCGERRQIPRVRATPAMQPYVPRIKRGPEALSVDPAFCGRGHPRTHENTYRHPDGRRSCVECRKLAMREMRERRKAG